MRAESNEFSSLRPLGYKCWSMDVICMWQMTNAFTTRTYTVPISYQPLEMDAYYDWPIGFIRGKQKRWIRMYVELMVFHFIWQCPPWQPSSSDISPKSMFKSFFALKHVNVMGNWCPRKFCIEIVRISSVLRYSHLFHTCKYK